ncbi:MAG: AzlD domain-containing protein [Spirochaetaceae bacterium]|jgi:branched-subunit amino acid transport protein AzlD|nr:AzlD domain-containing protein [Spirochaetaceae bacterium]
MSYIFISIFAMALATLFTRAFPFMLFSKRRPPKELIRSARLIPGAVMVVLVFTSLPMDLDIQSPEVWVPWLSVAVVAFLHLLFKHPLLSIFGGTAFYMFLIRLTAVTV